jgi:hypothetical protein
VALQSLLNGASAAVNLSKVILMKDNQRNSCDQFGADDENRDEISGAFSHPWCRCGFDGCGYSVGVHFTSVPISMQAMPISARNTPKPENAAVTAFALQRGNGSVVLLVASAGTIIFVELWRAGSRRGGDCCVRSSK